MGASKEREQEILNWFKNELLPKEVKKKRFPEDADDWTPENVEFEITERGVDHFASSPYFVKVKFRNEKTKENRYLDLVVKFISQDPAFRAAMKTEGQFYNEATMYNVVLPAFRDYLKDKSETVRGLVEEICPVSYYAAHDARSPEKSVVVLEDLRKRGFKTAESRVELDVDHCRSAITNVARFHAVSLAMKLEAQEKLNELKNVAVEIHYVDLPEQIEFGEKFFAVQNARAIDYLLSNGASEVPAEYLRKIRKTVTENVVELSMRLVAPKEPTALICHGDFCRNNILFRYENGKAVEAKLFDFQTFRYAPVSHDLSFFFYMNTTLELREKHFDDLLLLYHSTLIRTAAEIAGVPEAEPSKIFPYEKFVEEYETHAIYGYSIAAFFLPMMMAPDDKDKNFEEDFASMTVEEMTKDTFERGGEVVTKRIAEILIDFYRRKYYANGIRPEK